MPIRTNDQTRDSRLFPSMWAYVRRNTASIFRVYALYEPLRVFLAAAILTALVAAFIWVRFAYFFVTGDSGGHVQSLILGSTLFIVAVQFAALGVLGDILAGSRVLQQRILERVRNGGAAGGRPALALRARRGGDRPAPDHRRRRRTGDGQGGHGHGRGARGAATVSAPAATQVPTGNTFDKYG